MPESAFRSFVLDNDPIPRAALSVDPTFSVVRQWGAVKGLLALREWALGTGVALTPTKFLFDNVGEVHLIRWTPEAGQQVKEIML